jgi:hypothetical protein
MHPRRPCERRDPYAAQKQLKNGVATSECN